LELFWVREVVGRPQHGGPSLVAEGRLATGLRDAGRMACGRFASRPLGPTSFRADAHAPHRGKSAARACRALRFFKRTILDRLWVQ